ncbi:MAG: FecR domain-containing protein [Treponemataceae bacterium]
MRILVAVLFFSLFSSPLFAEVAVKAVKGTVGVMAGKGKLQAVKVGMKLTDDATVVTGANSEVTIIVNNGTITLKSLTTAKLRGIGLTPTASTANVALRNGTVVSDVKQITGLKTSFTVTTPVGTSSVRGTTHTVSYGPERGMSVAVSAGIVAVSSLRGASRPVAAGNSYTEGTAASAPQVVSQTTQESASAGAATVFAPTEDAAISTGSGSETPAATELATLVANIPTTGSVLLTLLFP